MRGLSSGVQIIVYIGYKIAAAAAVCRSAGPIQITSTQPRETDQISLFVQGVLDAISTIQQIDGRRLRQMENEIRSICGGQWRYGVTYIRSGKLLLINNQLPRVMEGLDDICLLACIIIGASVNGFLHTKRIPVLWLPEKRIRRVLRSELKRFLLRWAIFYRLEQIPEIPEAALLQC